ncbi:MAG TPA: ABC transporter permease [Vicinamibacterales bacterium]|nr:ABC transporter permease [Vicinamibacterales bacterium]
MTLFRKLSWWLQRRRREAELREELEFHLDEEADARRADGLPSEQARSAARRDLGNVMLLREETRTLWSWALLEQFAQDVRFGLRAMLTNRMFTALAALSLALGIGANTAIYSFMDAILLRSLPVSDPASLAVIKWRSKPVAFGRPAKDGPEFVVRSMSGRIDRDASGLIAAIFPFPAFDLLQQSSSSVLSHIFAYQPAGRINVLIRGEAEQAVGEYVTGDFFRGLAVLPAAGRMIATDDDRLGAPAVTVISMGYSQRRFGSAASAVGQSMLIDNVPFTVVGVAPSEFFGVDPGANPDVYLPMRAKVLFDPSAASTFLAPDFYWLQMMGRLRPGVGLEQAQAALAPPFAQWVASTAINDKQRANLPVLRVDEGAGGLDSLRRQYSKPLYVLLAMVGLILAIACANTANLLLARATARTREMAVRLSLGAGRFRVIRQLLTESVLLAVLSGAAGIAIAVAGTGLLTRLLANGEEGLTIHAQLNWQVLLVTLGLALLCGVLFGIVPAIQSTRPALIPALKDPRAGQARPRTRAGMRFLNVTQTLVVLQVAISLLLLVTAGLFVRTLSNLQSIEVGFNRDNVLLFELNAPQAGYTSSEATAFYDDLRVRFAGIPGVRAATLSHESLISAGRQLPILVDGAPATGTRILGTGAEFSSTMQIPMRLGRQIDERDQRGQGAVAVVVSDLFAREHFHDENPIGRRIRLGGSAQRDLEIVGVAASVRYGGIKQDIQPLVYIPYSQVEFPPLRQMTYALRTDGDPLRYVSAVRQIVHATGPRVPVTNVKTQVAEIEQTINQEIVFARLCSAFAILALIIACVGLYGTMTYAVARRTNDIGIRVALGARRGAVVWMVLREACVLTALGLAISVPVALASSHLLESLLFKMKPNDPGAMIMAVVILVIAGLTAGYVPAWRASRISPMIAIRQD